MGVKLVIINAARFLINTMKKYLLRIWQGLLVLGTICFFINYRLVRYGVGQLEGQIRVLVQARPLAEIMNDDEFPDSLKLKLQYIQEIKKYAVDSLGLAPSGSYNSVFDQKDKDILWVITAAEPYKMNDHMWSFPILGEVSYKGYFDSVNAVNEMADLKEQGLDVGIRTVSAWSTLGVFDDPVLSKFLYRTEAQLANLIIHELTHGTLFVKDNIVYNENLANFVGKVGALRYLKYKYGTASDEVLAYAKALEDQENYIRLVLEGSTELEKVYLSFEDVSLTDTEKSRKKKETINAVVNSINQYAFHNKAKYYIDKEKVGRINNTFFLGIKRYNGMKNQFEEEFKNDFNENFDAYLTYLKKEYPSI